MGKDTYALTGGHLAWLNADGTERTMPLTPDQFDPSQGASVAIPLLALEGFLHDLKRGRSVKYKAEGLSFEINSGTGKWKATFAGDQFKGDMAPRRDAIRVQVLLGGRTISDQTFVIQRHTTVLSFNAR